MAESYRLDKKIRLDDDNLEVFAMSLAVSAFAMSLAYRLQAACMN